MTRDQAALADPLAALRRAPDLLKPVASAFDHRLADWGATARGVYWRNEDGQQLRFQVLARVLEGDMGPLTINDLGCGYGAFFDYLAPRLGPRLARFVGTDISPAMIREAKARIDDPRAVFVRGLAAGEDADYSFASGTFNMCLGVDPAEWIAYVEASLAHLYGRSHKAMAFNMLAGRGKVREGLYYADPALFVAFCQGFGARVELVTDYPLDEWTIFVRR
jgi:SAM-dependent methyltransferase